MAFGKKNQAKVIKMDETIEVIDPTGWMVENSISEFLLMHTIEIKFMCMVAYCFFGGVKVFNANPRASPSHKFVSLVFTCTGGGILVPIFLNALPVPLSNDYYVMAMVVAFAIHWFAPILREVYAVSKIFETTIIIMFETLRAFVVCNFTSLAGQVLPASAFAIPIFGPIMCGAVAGCGGAFLPLNKGLDPIMSGLAAPMATSVIAASSYHLYLNTPMSEGCINAKDKAQVHVAIFFISVSIIKSLGLSVLPEAPSSKPSVNPIKKDLPKNLPKKGTKWVGIY